VAAGQLAAVQDTREDLVLVDADLHALTGQGGIEGVVVEGFDEKILALYSRGLSTRDCVKPPYRTRSQSRISSLAAIARRIADDRALKAPGQPSCSIARVLAMPGGFPRPRFTMRVNTMMMAPIRVMTNGLCRRSRRAKRAIVSADRRGS
jgi:hypothetical protein